MAKFFIGSADQGVVIFKIWQSLTYKKRIFISLLLIMTGFILQVVTFEFFPGIIPVFLATLLLLPSGYHNRVKVGKYDPKAAWEKIEQRKLAEFLELEKKIKKWDKSILDISNFRGGFIFLLLFVFLGCLFVYSVVEDDTATLIVTINITLLFIPYWFTGLRSIYTMPLISRKINIIFSLMEKVKDKLPGNEVSYYVLLKGKKTQLPKDVKFKVTVANQHPDFLGLYGQIVMNNVQSVPYPYFYMVLVAKKDSGLKLKSVYQNYLPSGYVIKEFKSQNDVEVLVIRQNTKIKKGYFTKDDAIYSLFLEGLNLAKQEVVNR